MPSEPQPSFSSPKREATAREFLTVLFRRKWIVLGLFLVTTATVMVIAFSTPVRYVSSGRVLIKRGEKEGVLSPYRRVGDWKEDMANEVEVVASVPVTAMAQAILDRARAGRAPLRIHPGQVDVQVLGQSNVMIIGYVDEDADVAHRVCDALLAAYVEHRNQAVNLPYPRDFFEGEISRVEQELQHSEAQRRAFASQAGVSDLFQQRNAAITRQANLMSRRSEYAVQLEEARAGLRLTEELARNAESDLPMLGHELYLGDEGVLGDLKIKILNQETRVAALRERYREDAPEVVNAIATLQTLRALLQREMDFRVKRERARVQMLEARLAPIDREYLRLGAELALMPAKEQSMNELDREIALLKKRHGDLVSNSDQARIMEQTSPRLNVIVLSPPGPAIASNARDYVRLALAPVFSLVVGLGLAFFVDGLDSRMRTAGDVETALELPVLASVTERRRRRGSIPARLRRGNTPA
jgi:uncharacterized protein involved in exopolysaccharide biosynthesis